MRWLFLLVAVTALPGCYYTQAIHGQLELLSKRKPIEQVAADTDDPVLRERLELALEIREFAVSDLGLPDNRSYRSYADIGRPYVVWNVIAAEEFSVEPKTWCFPVAGCVSYRGYFNEAAATRYAERLKAQDYDVNVTGVAAYSSLGRFADPVLNTMLRNDDIRLAAMMFHELAHQRLYVRSHTAFNEAFATMVEEEGMRRWLDARGEPGALEAYAQRRARSERFAQLMLETRERLRAIYAQDIPAGEMRELKAAAFDELRARYRAVRDEEWNGYEGYDRFFSRDLNNAHLVAVAAYHDLVPAFRELLAGVGGDLQAFYEAAERLGPEGLADGGQRIR